MSNVNTIGLFFAGLWDILFEVVAALYRAEGCIKKQWQWLIDVVEISCVSILIGYCVF